MKEAEQNVIQKQIKLPYFNLFMGTGLMYNFFAYFKMYEVKDSVNIIIEKDLEIFRNLVSCVNLTEILNNQGFHFLIGEAPTSLFTKINQIIHATNAKFYAKSVNIIEDPGSFITNKDYYINAIKLLKDAITEVILFYGNDPFDSMIGIENTFSNIEEIINYPGIKDLKDKFKGKPGVVVSTGPSLDKNIELLKGLENKAVICAADASVRVMKKYGLKPHLVSSLERMTPTAKLFEDLTEEDVKDVFLAATPVIHPQTYSNYPGERIITYRNFATFQWLGIEKGMLEIGPSAGNMAFKILEYLGCDPIILIGQDLAFGDDDNTHAEGSTYGEKQEHQSFKEIREVEGNYKPIIKTTRVWEMFLQYYHKDASTSRARVINATEGGAKILGTEIMLFKDAVKQFINEDINVLATVKEALHKPTNDEASADRQSTLDIVTNGLTYCHKAQEVFGESMKICDEYMQEVWGPYNGKDNYDREKGNHYLGMLEDQCDIFQDKNFYEVLMHYVQSYFLRTMIEINGAKSSSPTLADAHRTNVLHLKDMFNVMIGLNGKMIMLMEKLKSDLQESIDKAEL
jgi:hypothetical protein